MVDGVVVKPLKQIVDERGRVMHMLRVDSPLFTRFGEIYFSVVNPDVVKAWKRHQKMTQHFAVPVGKIKLVLYDTRVTSSTYDKIEILESGEDNYCLIKIPPLIWYGFKGISSKPSLIANCSDMPHDPKEVERVDEFNDLIPYNWELKDV